MINVGEQLVSSYLRYIRGCDFIQTNIRTIDSHGEIDVVGVDQKNKKVYVCEVAIHLTTGMQYVKDKRPNNINKLTEKFSRDIEYAEKFFPDYDRHYMLWSPIVKNLANPIYNQTAHIEQIGANIKATHNVAIDFMINDRFLAAINEMRVFARRETAELQCPVMRFLQIEEYLTKHVAKNGSTCAVLG
jgi:hypothetical protein